MNPAQAKTIYTMAIAISICCMHCVIVPSQEQTYEQMMVQEHTRLLSQPRQSDRQATAAACEVIRQQRVIEEQIHISTIAKELKKQTEELKAFTVERQHTIETARARLAQAMQTPFLHVPATDNNDPDQPVGPSQSYSPRAE